MDGAANAQYEAIKAFSETDQTEDFKAITVPTFVLHCEDDQLVPVADARKSIKLLKNGNLKLYAGAPHGMHTTHADVLDNDILALIQAK